MDANVGQVVSTPSLAVLLIPVRPELHYPIGRDHTGNRSKAAILACVRKHRRAAGSEDATHARRRHRGKKTHASSRESAMRHGDPA